MLLKNKLIAISIAGMLVGGSSTLMTTNGLSHKNIQYKTTQNLEAHNVHNQGTVITKNGRQYWVGSWKGYRSGWRYNPNLGGYQYFSPISKAAVESGLIEISGKLYDFNNNITQSGFRNIKGDTYYFNRNNRDAASTGITKIPYDEASSYAKEQGDSTINLGSDHKLVSFAFSDEGKALVGLNKISNKEYLTDSIGVIQTGRHIFNGKTYLFNSHGVDVTGWVFNYDPKIYAYNYFNPNDNGAMVVNNFAVVNSTTYGFSKNGSMLKNTYATLGGKDFYFGGSGGAISGWKYNYDLKGWQYFSSKYESGALIGLEDINGYTYYFDSEGIMQTGLQTINGNYYYFYPDGYMAKNVTVYPDGVGMYFGANGQLEP